MILSYNYNPATATTSPKIIGLGFVVLSFNTFAATVGGVTLGVPEVVGASLDYPAVKGATTYEYVAGSLNQYPVVTLKG